MNLRAALFSIGEVEMGDGFEQRGHNRRIHFDGTVTMGHIIQVITILVPVIAWGITVESRLSAAAAMSVANDRYIGFLQQQQQRDNADIKRSLERIENKLDQKADKVR